MKKLLSVVLAAVMACSLMVPALAVDRKETNVNAAQTRTIIVEQNTEHIITLRAVDYENGDCAFYLEDNGTIISESYVDRSTATVQNMNYNTGEGHVMECADYIAAMPVLYDTQTIATNKTAGTITYQYSSQGYVMGTRSVLLKYGEKNEKTTSYYPKGSYADLTELAGVLTAVLEIPGVISGVIAPWVVAVAGVGAVVTDIVLNDIGPVKADTNIVAWPGTGGSGTVKLQGNRYTFTYGGKTRQETLGNYYAVSCYSSHNKPFANLFYERIWGNGDFTILKWS